MSACGLIFSNIHDENISELTRLRTMASVPFMCRYRLIDFALSNMVNSGITNIGVITHYNYYSLMDHIGSGKDWDLARRSGGVRILPPYITASSSGANTLYQTRLEALKNIAFYVQRATDDYIVLSDCDAICSIDMRDIIDDHIKSGADLTVVVKSVSLTREAAQKNVIFESNSDGQITDIFMQPASMTGQKDVSLNIMVASKTFLETQILDAVAHNFNSFNRDVIGRNINHHNLRVYRYDGYYSSIKSFADYFAISMDLISNEAHRSELFAKKNAPIFTKIRNSAPTKYSDTAVITNSLVADGCTIDGTVENSILFRGVRVAKNAVVRNSILFQDTCVSERASLNCVVSDKYSSIRDGRVLSGCDLAPFYISKNTML